MAPTEGRVARPERGWSYRRGTPEREVHTSIERANLCCTG